MDIYLYQNNEQVGPFTEEQLRAMVKANTVSEVDNAWHEGLAEWQPLNTLITLRVSDLHFVHHHHHRRINQQTLK